MTEVHRAQPNALRRFILLIVAAAVLGVAVIVVMDMSRPALIAWATSDPSLTRMRVQVLIAGLGLLLFLPLLAAAAYLWLFGRRVLREERFPPQGASVLRDVPIVRGEAARRRARTLQTIGLVMAAAAVLMSLVLFRLATLPPRG
jgi:hypothetical protein